MDNNTEKSLQNMSLEEMMQADIANKCLSEKPQLFKQKWIEAYGQESWRNSTYAKRVDGVR